MNIAVLTPEREIFKGSISSVKVPGVKGKFQVLNNHAPIVSALEEGKVELVTAAGGYTFFDSESNSKQSGTDTGKKLAFKIEGGFIEVLNNEIALLIQGVSQL